MQRMGMADYPGVSQREVLKTMIMNLRVAELQILLQRTGHNKSGKKNVLQEKSLALLENISEGLAQLIFELHQKRFSSVKNYAQREQNPPNYPPYVPAQFQAPVVQPNQPQINPQNYQPARAIDINKFQNDAANAEDLEAIIEKYRKIILEKLNPSSFYDIVKTLRTPILCNSNSFDPEVMEAILVNYRKILEEKLNPSSFYDVVKALRTPILCKPNYFNPDKPTSREHVFSFIIDQLLISDITLTRVYSAISRSYENTCMVQLRICRIEDQFDYLPITLEVLLNGKPVTLPELTPLPKYSGLLRRCAVPIDLTNMLMLNPSKVNTITIRWDAKEQENPLGFIAFSVNVVKKVSGDELIRRLQTTKPRTSDVQSLKLVLEKFDQNGDDVMATTIRASMICPLGKMKMTTPSRSTQCKHVQCFDGERFIRLNEKRQKWQCPVCFQSISFTHIEMDELWVKILKQAPEESNEIEFNPDGSWTYVTTEPKKSFTMMNAMSPSFIMLDSDDSDDENFGMKRSSGNVECITIDDSDEDF